MRILSVTLAAVDISLAWFWIVDTLSTAQVVAAHAAAVGLAGGLALRLRRPDRTDIAAALLMALLLGPLGGVALVIGDLGRGGEPAPIARPAPRVAPPSRAELVHAEILQGRRPRVGASVPRPFSQVFASGSLARQQEAIAAISLGYRPQMLPALRLALASEVPALRVQAAAVFAKLRGSFGERAKALRAAAVAGPLPPDLAAEAEAVAASGFVDPDTAAELRAQAARVSGAPADRPRRSRDALLRPPRLKRHSCGGVA
ncbi:hypothetical protein [Rubellimicrobium roseum]|uniref:Uncharacterized protein n=1 Tax=Rubellimicrobium roseum TaxID=687525 RepID=A0A5C4NRF8_9RHOB|nr:hypothetical protein [Rubellimicrobium roseum]TNC74979.1 hypothetical protein FHG71_02320 [Rubellimicrobium roseum]